MISQHFFFFDIITFSFCLHTERGVIFWLFLFFVLVFFHLCTKKNKQQKILSWSCRKNIWTYHKIVIMAESVVKGIRKIHIFLRIFLLVWSIYIISGWFMKLQRKLDGRTVVLMLSAVLSWDYSWSLGEGKSFCTAIIILKAKN